MKKKKKEDLVYNFKKYPAQVHVYGGMSADGLTKLAIIDGKLNTEKYINDILPIILKKHQQGRTFFKTGKVLKRKLFKNPKKFIFEQDHASIHDSKQTQIYLEETKFFFKR